MSNITLGDNTLDSRDIEERIKELEESLREELEEQELSDALLDANYEANEDEEIFIDNNASDLEELRNWKNLRDELKPYCEWDHGATLINEDYFPTYAEEFASDIGAIDRNASWPLNHINWEAAANELKEDYTPAEVDGNTYLVLTC